MPDASGSDDAALDRLRRIDDLCDQFEREWQAGRRPAVAAFADGPDALRELIRLDVVYRRRAGEGPTAADYAAEFPAAAEWGDLFGEHDTPTLVVVDPPATHSLTGRTRFAVGRTSDADLTVRNPRCSRRQFELHRSSAGWQVVPVSAVNPTRLNGRRVTTATLLAHGDRIESGGLAFRFERADEPGRAEVPRPRAAARPATDSGTLRAEEFGGNPPRRQSPGLPPALVGDGLILGRDPVSDVVLSHPLVSRRHARVGPRSGRVVVSDLVSANGTFVNGLRVSGAVPLAPGDRLDIGPYSLRFTGTHLLPATRSRNAELRGWRISRVVGERGSGRPLTLLDDVSVTIPPGRFVCLIGPSGSGKSTLLAALSGRVKPDRGLVLVNDADLYGGFEAVKRDLALVPQKDLLHDALTPAETLTYTARLRLPPDSTSADIAREVEDQLETVGLSARRDVPVRQLSGGQLKRLSLANELIGRPTLVFLDEVTSGLDEQTDREMMDLFRAMADAGKTVVCVTHSLAHVERACHGVVVLAPGGVLAFAGSPAEAKGYFGVERLGDVYDVLAAEAPGEWRGQFERHPNAARPPAIEPDRAGGRVERVVWGGPSAALRHGRVLLHRRLTLLLRDRPAVLTLGVQTVAVVLALAVAFGDLSKAGDPFARARDAVTLDFLLAVSAFWFGCNGAVKVLVGDRPIWLRERAVNLSFWGYGSAAFALHAGIAVVQAALLAGGVWWLCRPPGEWWPVVGLLALTAAAGSALGFALSAVCESEEQAVAAVPLVLIPQIVFGGAVVALGGVAEWVAKAGITAYWAQRAVTAHLPEDVAARAGAERSDGGTGVGMLALHLAVYAVVAAGVTTVRDRRAFRR